MKKKVTELIVCLLSVICFLTACHTPQSEKLADGTYQADVTLTGGSGRATVDSPAALTVEGGKIYATIVWSSPYYDYMMVEDETYYNEAEAGENSTFTIPLEKLPCEISVIGDTTAMSVPHEIEYTLSFTLKETDFSELTKTGQWDLSYATQYQVEQYGKYDLITIADSRFLLVPENVPVPEHVPEDVVVLKQPLDHTYLVSSSVMDMIREIGALSDIRLTGVKESDWYIEEAASAMKSGSMLYAGKYNEPDYELILKEGCNFALENTMIGHNPEVKEKLESFGIPVLVDHSSYEAHPLGRTEWIRLYGVLTGKEKEAEAAFAKQEAALQRVTEEGSDAENAGGSVKTEQTAQAEKPSAAFLFAIVLKIRGLLLPTFAQQPSALGCGTSAPPPPGWSDAPRFPDGSARSGCGWSGHLCHHTAPACGHSSAADVPAPSTDTATRGSPQDLWGFPLPAAAVPLSHGHIASYS